MAYTDGPEPCYRTRNGAIVSCNEIVPPRHPPTCWQTELGYGGQICVQTWPSLAIANAAIRFLARCEAGQYGQEETWCRG